MCGTGICKDLAQCCLLFVYLFGLSFFASSQLSAIDMERRFFDRTSNAPSRCDAFDCSGTNGGGGGAIADAYLRASWRSIGPLGQPCTPTKFASKFERPLIDLDDSAIEFLADV